MRRIPLLAEQEYDPEELALKLAKKKNRTVSEG